MYRLSIPVRFCISGFQTTLYLTHWLKGLGRLQVAVGSSCVHPELNFPVQCTHPLPVAPVKASDKNWYYTWFETNRLCTLLNSHAFLDAISSICPALPLKTSIHIMEVNGPELQYHIRADRGLLCCVDTAIKANYGYGADSPISHYNVLLFPYVSHLYFWNLNFYMWFPLPIHDSLKKAAKYGFQQSTYTPSS